MTNDPARNGDSGEPDTAPSSAHETPGGVNSRDANAEAMLCRVLFAWQAGDFVNMLRMAQPTWKRGQARSFDNILGFRFFSPVKVVSMVTEPGTAECLVTIQATLEDVEGARIRTRVNMIREGGEWGWNPISAMRVERVVL